MKYTVHTLQQQYYVMYCSVVLYLVPSTRLPDTTSMHQLTEGTHLRSVHVAFLVVELSFLTKNTYR
jgi:hypothetical protein